MKMKILCIVGARPNFVKIAPIVDEFVRRKISFEIVHTGQHYDKNMSDGFFSDLNIPAVDVNLNVGGGSHAYQTSEIMKKFEPVLLQSNPDAVLVVGDVNSTIACALVAKKLFFKIIHVEAGLRSFDERMPEEINRVLTDRLSDFLFVTESSGMENLVKENISPKRLFFVGNVMIDSLIKNFKKIQESDILNRLQIEEKKYFLLTLHRPSNVDSEKTLGKLIRMVSEVENNMKVVFVAHPRTKKMMDQFNLKIESNIKVIEPVSYLDFLNLVCHAKAVFTDSGGIQEETSHMKVPCVTLRENTERPVTVTMGTNVLVSNFDGQSVTMAYKDSCNKSKHHQTPIPYWDGNAAVRIADILLKHIK